MSWLWGSSDSTQQDSSSSYNPSGDSFSSSFDSSSGISDSFSPSSSDALGLGSGSSGSAGDAELQQFLAKEQQRAQLQAMIHKMNDICWDTCISSPENKLSSRNETCIRNCVERFIDSTLFITNRFAQLLSKSAGGM